MDLLESLILGSLLISGILLVNWFYSLTNLWKLEVYKERLLLIRNLIESSLDKIRLANYYSVTITLPPDITCLVNGTHVIITNGYCDVVIRIPKGVIASYCNGTLSLRGV